MGFLDEGDKIGSIIGAMTGLASLIVAVIALRRDGTRIGNDAGDVGGQGKQSFTSTYIWSFSSSINSLWEHYTYLIFLIWFNSKSLAVVFILFTALFVAAAFGGVAYLIWMLIHGVYMALA